VSTESGRVEAREEASETGRLEAFSDGVFAIAVTLLVLDLHVPLGEEIRHGGLIRTLLAQWPIYLADALSFITILIFWVNHHATFKHITRTNQAFLILNGLLLLAISVIPFTTALLAEYIQRQERKAVEVVYSGTFVVAAVVYNRLWIYATRDRRLTSPDADMHTIDGITRQFHRGLAAYALSFVVAFFSAEVSLAICILLAIYCRAISSTGTPALSQQRDARNERVDRNTCCLYVTPRRRCTPRTRPVATHGPKHPRHSLPLLLSPPASSPPTRCWRSAMCYCHSRSPGCCSSSSP